MSRLIVCRHPLTEHLSVWGLFLRRRSVAGGTGSVLWPCLLAQRERPVVETLQPLTSHLQRSARTNQAHKPMR